MAAFVTTARVCVDNVDSPGEAIVIVGEANAELAEIEIGVQIRLPEPDSGYEWEKVNE